MRKGSAKRRILTPDPKYKDELVTRFVNELMLDGKKSVAYKIFYDTIDELGQKGEEEGLAIWKKALDNIMPGVEVRSRRVGGSTFQVPTEVRPSRKIALGMKWIIKYARDRSGKTMVENLSNELLAAAKGEGGAMKKRDDTHRMAEANKAFAHFKF